MLDIIKHKRIIELQGRGSPERMYMVKGASKPKKAAKKKAVKKVKKAKK